MLIKIYIEKNNANFLYFKMLAGIDYFNSCDDKQISVNTQRHLLWICSPELFSSLVTVLKVTKCCRLLTDLRQCWLFP